MNCSIKTIQLSSWIQERGELFDSKDDYIKYAVEIALMLTNRLCEIEKMSKHTHSVNERNPGIPSGTLENAKVEIPTVDIELLGMGFFSNTTEDKLQALHEQTREREKARMMVDEQVNLGMGFFSRMTNTDCTTTAETDSGTCSLRDRNCGDEAGSRVGKEWNNFRIIDSVEIDSEVVGDFDDAFDVFVSETYREDFLFKTPSLGNILIKLVGKNKSPRSVIRSRDACFALGLRLLDLFSKGASQTVILDGKSQNTDGPRLDSLNMNGNGHSDLPPKSKRSAVEHEGGDYQSLPFNARKLLLGLGLPLSICRLVCDLLESRSSSEFRPDSAITSLGQAQNDLKQMKDHPTIFLFDRSCPQQAFDDVRLFRNPDTALFGRDRELLILENLAENVAGSTLREASGVESAGCSAGFLCEAAFLSGFSGSGKSACLDWTRNLCQSSIWHVMECKFDRQKTPLAVFAKALDRVFEGLVTMDTTRINRRQQSFYKSANRIAQSISMLIDITEIFQLQQIMPNLVSFMSIKMNVPLKNGGTATLGAMLQTTKMGSGRNQAHYVFYLLLKSILSGGLPLLLILDDLERSDASLIFGCILELVSSTHHLCEERLLIIGSHCSDMPDDCDLFKKISSLEAVGQPLNVTRLAVTGLTPTAMHEIISFNLGLPMRLTASLANIAHRKTGGSPFYLKMFLASLMAEKTVRFSVKSRRWVWDDDIVSMKVIADGVAAMITRRLGQIPTRLIASLKIASCIGVQFDVAVMSILHAGDPIEDVVEVLDSGVEQGLLDKAGTLYAFSHDSIHSAVYKLIAEKERIWLHKHIGLALVGNSSQETSMLFRGVDQINLCKDEGILTPDEFVRFAALNLTAGRTSLSGFNYGLAQKYFEAGVSMLQNAESRWKDHYSLSKELHERLADIFFINGESKKIESLLNTILTNAKSFDDRVHAELLKTKCLWSTGKMPEAISNGIKVLAQLGESFPEEIELATVTQKLTKARIDLKDITKESFLSLAPMPAEKSTVMKFLSILTIYALGYKPMMMPLLSCRMVDLTLRHGFCSDSVVGLAVVAHGMIFHLDDIKFGYRLGKLAESLLEVSSSRHLLRSRLNIILEGCIKPFVEPLQSLRVPTLEAKKSCKIAGDLDGAMLVQWIYSSGGFYMGLKLSEIEGEFWKFITQLSRHRAGWLMYCAMSVLRVANGLSESNVLEHINQKVIVKSHEELHAIAEKDDISHLKFQVHIDQVSEKFWNRDFAGVAALTEKYHIVKARRTLEIYHSFYEGIAALNLARESQDEDGKWKEIGAKAIKRMEFLAENSTWNFENKLLLLQSEMNYLNGDQEMAIASYESAIKSAHDHRFVHEEALSHELYGHFCMENSMPQNALEQFRHAVEKYTLWGATKKVREVEEIVANLYFDPQIRTPSNFLADFSSDEE